MTTSGKQDYVFDGGTPADQQQLQAFYEQVWRANDALDDATLRPVWTEDPQCVSFNTNGHTYYGIEEWFGLWAHYRTRLASSAPSSSKQVRVMVRGDMAVIIDDWRRRALQWIGQETEPDYVTSYMRITMVCLREDGEWKGMHVHYSSGKTGPRPEQTA